MFTADEELMSRVVVRIESGEFGSGLRWERACWRNDGFMSARESFAP